MVRPLAVMFIDDSKSDRLLFQEMLKDIDPDIQYIPVADGLTALRYLNNFVNVIPDFIFLDANMPEMDGIECLQQIKKIRLVRHVPVIIYTSSAHRSLEETAKILGAKTCLEKTTNFKKAREAVASLIGY